MIGSVTPQQSGPYAQMYHAHFSKIEEDTHRGRKRTNKNMSPSPWISTMSYLCVHTYTCNTVSVLVTLSTSKAQQTVKVKTEWKRWENKKMEKQRISVYHKRWTDRWWDNAQKLPEKSNSQKNIESLMTYCFLEFPWCGPQQTHCTMNFLE